MQGFFGGISAEVLCNLLRNPFELMKQNMQVGNENSLRGILRHIYGNYGFRGLYKGFGPLLLREIPFSCIQMPTYELAKSMYIRHDKPFMTTTETLKAGFIAGSVAAVLTNPIDVIKTNIMTQRTVIYSGFADCAAKLYEDHGLKVFGRGMVYRVSAIGSMSLFFFGGYETFMRLLSDKF